MSAARDKVLLASDLAQRIAPLLQGNPPEVIGAALADLLATLLAGHVVDGDTAETERLRSDLLEMHIQVVKVLIQLKGRGFSRRD